MTKGSDQKNVQHHPSRVWIKILGIIIFLAFCVIIGYFIGRPMLRFVSEPEMFRLWVNSHGMLGWLAFIGMMALQVVLALIPGEPLEIGAGYAFGFWKGTLLSMIGIALGGAMVFGMTRKWGVKVVSLFFSMEKIQSLKFLQDEKRLHVITFFLFFIPGTPKDLLTYVVGLTPIRFKTYFIISNIARIPSVVTSTVGGNALGEQKYVFAIVTFAVVAAVSIIGMLLYRYITKKRAEHKEKNSHQSELSDTVQEAEQKEENE